jgi:thiol-disulfide isomerase/thioredoxin
MRAFTLLACVLFSSAPALAQDLPEPGKPAQMFRLPVYNVEPVGQSLLGLEQYVGRAPKDKEARVVLLSFMASFCAPCKKEMPWLQALHQQHKGKGLRVVMVAIDKEPEGQKIIEELIAQNQITYPVLKDRYNVVALRWLGKKTLLPSVFLVSPDGTVLSSHRGYSEESLKALEAEVLAAVGAHSGTAAPTTTAGTGAP